MTNLTNILTESMLSLGVQDILPQTKKHIRRKLESEFKKSLEIFSDEKGRLLVVPENLSKEMLVIKNSQLATEIDVLKSESRSDMVEQCALLIRSDIKQSKEDNPWPPQPDQLTNTYLKVPDSVSNFLTVLLTGKCFK